MTQRLRGRIKEELGITTWQYTADNVRDREYEMKEFNRRGGIMLGIKCLDQGVNIPAIPIIANIRPFWASS